MSSGATVFGEDISNFMDRWIGSVAVVTGASSGIGAAVAEKLVKIGLTVVGLARRLPQMEELAVKLSEETETGKFVPMFCDLADENSILEVFAAIEENIGGISILINNAGVMRDTRLVDGDISMWRAVLDVNILGLCICTREAVASMKKHELDGQIIHINSITGHYLPPVPNLNLYPPSKYAVTALTEILRRELGALEAPKIKISAISPGLVATELLGYFPEEGGVKDGLANCPQLAPQDIADTVAFILSTPPHVQVHDIIVKVVGEAF